MALPYNPKIMTNGEFRPFHGYTVVSMASNNMKPIETFIRNSPLSEYYSALPSESYHMTVFNIWCHGNKLLPHQKEYVDNEYTKYARVVGEDLAKKEKLRILNLVKGPDSLSWGWPDQVMLPKMIQVSTFCKKTLQEKFIVNVEPLEGGTLTLSVSLDNERIWNYLNKIRNKCTNVFKKDDSNLRYHITLAYRYKDIPESDRAMLLEEFEKLKALVSELCSNKIILEPPNAYWFTNMENYLTQDELYF